MLLTFTKLNIVYLAMIISGLSIGFSYLAVIKNCWSYFPNRKGLISGLIMTGFGLSSFIFTSIADFIINPNSQLANKDGFYPPEIAMRVYKFIFIEFIIMIIVGSFSVLMTFPNHDEKYGQIYQSENLLKNKIEENLEMEPASKALKSKMYLLSLIMVFCSLCKFI
jgi:MFS transporter, OFA family, oxalate/formate antiporter